MTCVVCKRGQTHPGHTTVTLEHQGATLVVRSVPAQVCENCGESYVDAAVTRRLLQAAQEALRPGVQVDVREFAATSA